MGKKTEGPAFLRFAAPIVDTLTEFGGTAPAGAVTARVIERTNLSLAEQSETTSNGQARYRNQIHWARFYLAKAGLIDAPGRAQWRLTDAGRKAKLDAVGVLALFTEVQRRFKSANGNGFTVGHDEDDLEAPDEDEKTDLGGVDSDEDEDRDGQSIDSPYDPSKTVIETKLYSMDLLVRRLKYGEIRLDPEFQRGANLWTEERMSRLVESILIRIPLPVFYFDATNEHEWVVVDGLQRLSTIKRFVVEDNLNLKRLEYLKQHEGKKFSTLPRDLRRRIEETPVAASVPGAKAFELEPLCVELNALDDAGIITGTTEHVPHVWGRRHLAAQRESLRERVLRRVQSGVELWRRRGEVLTSLDFCARVERDLAALTGSEPWFFEICRHLAVLSDSLGIWAGGPFNPPDLTWSYESKQTLVHPVYGAQREFDAPDGQRRQFSAHTKLNAVKWRIYFLPDDANRRALIGYIGPHLDTVRFH